MIALVAREYPGPECTSQNPDEKTAGFLSLEGLRNARGFGTTIDVCHYREGSLSVSRTGLLDRSFPSRCIRAPASLPFRCRTRQTEKGFGQVLVSGTISAFPDQDRALNLHIVGWISGIAFFGKSGRRCDRIHLLCPAPLSPKKNRPEISLGSAFSAGNTKWQIGKAIVRFPDTDEGNRRASPWSCGLSGGKIHRRVAHVASCQGFRIHPGAWVKSRGFFFPDHRGESMRNRFSFPQPQIQPPSAIVPFLPWHYWIPDRRP